MTKTLNPSNVSKPLLNYTKLVAKGPGWRRKETMFEDYMGPLYIRSYEISILTSRFEEDP